MLQSILHRSTPRARGSKATETIYRVEQSFSYEAVSDTEYQVRNNVSDDDGRSSDFRVVSGVGNTFKVTKRSLSDLQGSVTFNVTKKRSTFFVTLKNPRSAQGITYVVSKTTYGFNLLKISDDEDELVQIHDAAADQECLDAFDVGVLMCELDAEDDWDSLPTSPPRFTVPSTGSLPADMEAAIAARRRVNACRMLF